jgi:predicted RNA-binding Zn-ribbon protein involved in translation (DUF1610 family)
MLRKKKIALFRFATVPLLLACSSSGMMREAHYTGAQEYRCAYKEIHVKELGEGRFQVTGCGNEGVFRCGTSGALGRPYSCVREGTGD